MRNFYILLLTLIVMPIVAQNRLSDSRQSSEHTYIYTISHKNLRKVYLKDKPIKEDMFGSMVDQYRVDSVIPLLPRGNYLLVTAKGNQFEVKPYTVDDLNYRIMPASDFRLLLTDTLGNLITDAKVKQRYRPISFDSSLQLYRCGKLDNGDMVEMNHRGVVHYIKVQTTEPMKQSFWKRISSFFKSIGRGVKSWFVTPEVDPASFMVFSKLRYKPGETVRMKAYVTTKDGEPIQKVVGVRLKSRYRYSFPVDTLLTTLTPYRAGMFEFDFPLTDSLNLALDRDYDVSLELDGQSLLTRSFKYEDYELKGLTLTLQAGKKTFTANDTLRIGFDVRDENGMAVNDGRLQIQVMPNTLGDNILNAPDFYFIPDTLWSTTCYLDTLTMKRFTIPNSVFPGGVTMGFRVQCTYLSPDNESCDEVIALQHDASAYTLASRFEKGMLSLTEYYNEMIIPVDCKVRFATQDNEVSQDSLRLPGKIAVPWNATRIEVTTPHGTKTYDAYAIENFYDKQLGYDFYRRNDSVGLKVDNPSGLPFWYSLRRNNKVVESGYNTQLNLQLPKAGKDGYAFTLSYLFGGEIRSLDGSLPYFKSNLSMEVTTPLQVSPGQTVPVKVALSNQKGLPVVGADVTAFAYTSKFNADVITGINQTGVYREAKPFTTTWYYGNQQGKEPQWASLDWPKWRDVMSLDTIAYYQFLYPEYYYSTTEDSRDNQTLVAPFVVADGNVLDIGMLWIDDVLYYTNCVEQSNPYVFEVKPGVHRLRFRTPQYEVEVENVLVREGKKSIYSFNVMHPNMAVTSDMPRIQATELPKSQQGYFSDAEIQVLTNNLIMVNNVGSRITFGNVWNYLKLPQWIQGGNRLYSLATNNRASAPLLVGPFPQRYAMNRQTNLLQMYEMDSLWVNFPFAGGNLYTFYPNYALSQDWDTWVSFSSIPSGAKPDFRAMPIDKADIYQRFEEQKLLQSQQSVGLIVADTVGVMHTEGKAQLSINLTAMSDDWNKAVPVFIYMEGLNGITSLYYGSTLYFNNLQSGKTRITLCYADSTYVSRICNLREGGRNVLRVNNGDRVPVDNWSRSLFRLFDSSLKTIPVVNPFIGSTEDMTIQQAPTSWPLTAVNRDRGDVKIRGTAPMMMSNQAMAKESSDLAEMAVTGMGARIQNEEKESTVDSVEESAPEKSLRHDFRDDAFWQPSLTTDANGEVTFDVTYPDDITAWDAFFIGVGNKHQQNYKQLRIRSLLMRSARLSVPRFAIEGDSLVAIGRIVNHQGDTVAVERSFTANGKTESAHLEVAKTYLDSIPVVANQVDSLTVVYQIAMLDGTSDGEERKIPVFQKGMLKAEGEFCVLNNTEKQTLRLDTDAPATLHAETTPLKVFLDEIARVADYPYDCNEQMASKIKMLLARKSIYSTLGKRDNDNRQIQSLINKLVKNQNADGLWGWWNKDASVVWILEQVIEALSKAEADGYRVNWNKQQAIQSLQNKLNRELDMARVSQTSNVSYLKANLLDMLICLKQLDASSDYNYYLAQINTVLPEQRLMDRIKEMQLLVMTGQLERVDKAWLMKAATKTLLGSIYWEEKSDKPMVRFMLPNQNQLITTVEAYEVLRAANAPAEVLQQIRNYFFEWRRTGYWQNTYESSRILETILPDMQLTENPGETVFFVNGEAVSKLPYTASIEADKEVTVNKTGASPVFVTLYSQAWEANPIAETKKGFRVTSRFKDGNAVVEQLQAGKPVVLEVEVTCDEAATYVQLEVPIPAGCSYNSKSNGSWWSGEAHREYFKEKTLIFCPELKPGTHTYQIELMPRYSGRYTLNPAKAELMYFPTFYGNEPIKTVSVTD